MASISQINTSLGGLTQTYFVKHDNKQLTLYNWLWTNFNWGGGEGKAKLPLQSIMLYFVTLTLESLRNILPCDIFPFSEARARKVCLKQSPCCWYLRFDIAPNVRTAPNGSLVLFVAIEEGKGEFLLDKILNVDGELSSKNSTWQMF